MSPEGENQCIKYHVKFVMATPAYSGNKSPNRLADCIVRGCARPVVDWCVESLVDSADNITCLVNFLEQCTTEESFAVVGSEDETRIVSCSYILISGKQFRLVNDLCTITLQKSP